MPQPPPTSTCKIYYGGPDGNNSHFPPPKNISAIHHLDLHYHLQPNPRTHEPIANLLSGTTAFDTSPIWHFVRSPIPGAPAGYKPSLTIILTHEGRGTLPDDYSTMLDDLHDLMHQLMAAGFARVVVQLRGEGGGPFGNKAARKRLRGSFEEQMGPAEVLDGREGCELEFDLAAHYDEWEESQQMMEAFMD